MRLKVTGWQSAVLVPSSRKQSARSMSSYDARRSVGAERARIARRRRRHAQARVRVEVVGADEALGELATATIVLLGQQLARGVERDRVRAVGWRRSRAFARLRPGSRAPTARAPAARRAGPHARIEQAIAARAGPEADEPPSRDRSPRLAGWSGSPLTFVTRPSRTCTQQAAAHAAVRAHGRPVSRRSARRAASPRARAPGPPRKATIAISEPEVIGARQEVVTTSGARKRHVEDPPDRRRGPVRHHHDAVGEEERLVHVVRDHDHGSVRCRSSQSAHQLVLQLHPGQRVEEAERLVEQEQPAARARTRGRCPLAAACRRRAHGGIALAHPAERRPTPSRSPRRGRDRGCDLLAGEPTRWRATDIHGSRVGRLEDHAAIETGPIDLPAADHDATAARRVSPIRIESTVDLPQPEWPRRQTNSPSVDVEVKSRTMTAGPGASRTLLPSWAISTKRVGPGWFALRAGGSRHPRRSRPLLDRDEELDEGAARLLVRGLEVHVRGAVAAAADPTSIGGAEHRAPAPASSGRSGRRARSPRPRRS